MARTTQPFSVHSRIMMLSFAVLFSIDLLLFLLAVFLTQVYHPEVLTFWASTPVVAVICLIFCVSAVIATRGLHTLKPRYCLPMFFVLITLVAILSSVGFLMAYNLVCPPPPFFDNDMGGEILEIPNNADEVAKKWGNVAIVFLAAVFHAASLLFLGHAYKNVSSKADTLPTHIYNGEYARDEQEPLDTTVHLVSNKPSTLDY